MRHTPFSDVHINACPTCCAAKRFQCLKIHAAVPVRRRHPVQWVECRWRLGLLVGDLLNLMNRAAQEPKHAVWTCSASWIEVQCRQKLGHLEIDLLDLHTEWHVLWEDNGSNLLNLMDRGFNAGGDKCSSRGCLA